MKVAHIVDLVELRMTGGQPTQDGNLFREDIVAYLPAATGKALDMWRDRQLAQARVAKRENLTMPSPIPYTTRQVSFPKAEGLVSAEIDIVNSSSFPGVSSVGCGTCAYIPVSERSAIAGMQLPGPFWFIEGKTVFVGGLQGTGPVDVTAIWMGEDSDIQDSIARDVIELCCEHFREQMQTPADGRLTNTDRNES